MISAVEWSDVYPLSPVRSTDEELAFPDLDTMTTQKQHNGMHSLDAVQSALRSEVSVPPPTQPPDDNALHAKMRDRMIAVACVDAARTRNHVAESAQPDRTARDDTALGYGHNPKRHLDLARRMPATQREAFGESPAAHSPAVAVQTTPSHGHVSEQLGDGEVVGSAPNFARAVPRADVDRMMAAVRATRRRIVALGGPSTTSRSAPPAAPRRGAVVAAALKQAPIPGLTRRATDAVIAPRAPPGRGERPHPVRANDNHTAWSHGGVSSAMGNAGARRSSATPSRAIAESLPSTYRGPTAHELQRASNLANSVTVH
jgi:hypothetical protein